MCSRQAGTVAAHRLRQRSRRPARHVVYPFDVFPDSIFASREIGVRFQLIPSLQADSEGVFFSSESAEKKHTGWVGQA